MGFLQTIEDQLQLNKSVCSLLQSAAANGPKGSIVTRRRKNGPPLYYLEYKQELEDGSVKRKTRCFLPGEEMLFRQIRMKAASEKLLGPVRKNIRILDDLKSNYSEITMSALSEILPAKYLQEMFPPLQTDGFCFDSLNAAGETYRAEELRYSLDGVRLRTRIEYMIASGFVAYQVPYIYEPVIASERFNYYPDFAVLRKSDGRVIFWEHFGMMDDPDYCGSRFERLRKLWHLGIRIGDNLVLTLEGGGCPSVTMEHINRLIETYCL